MILKLLARETAYKNDIWDYIINLIDNCYFEGNKTDIILHIIPREAEFIIYLND